MNDIVIKFEGNEVIIRGPKEILKIVIDPSVGGIQKITSPEKQGITSLPKPYRVKAKKEKVVEKKKSGKGVRITQNIIDSINYMRDEEKATSKEIAKELGISLATVNRYYRPKTSEHEIN